jgi:hypothetical protein
MAPSVDNKKYANDTRKFSDAVLQDGVFKSFLDSPVSNRIQINDVCYYAPGMLNKIGKEGKTSWDSFSYAIQMGHNVWMHLNAVQEANRQYDAGLYPGMLIQESFDRVTFRQVVDEIFSANDRATAEAIIEKYNKFWMSIPGTRGAIGKKTMNAGTMFNELFEEEVTVTETPDEHHVDDSGLDETNLDNLEAGVDE